jgi:hypothetical protein
LHVKFALATVLLILLNVVTHVKILLCNVQSNLTLYGRGTEATQIESSTLNWKEFLLFATSLRSSRANVGHSDSFAADSNFDSVVDSLRLKGHTLCSRRYKTLHRSIETERNVLWKAEETDNAYGCGGNCVKAREFHRSYIIYETI